MARKRATQKAQERRKKKKIDQSFIIKYAKEIVCFNTAMEVIDLIKIDVPDRFIGMTWNMDEESFTIKLFHDRKHPKTYGKDWSFTGRGNDRHIDNVIECINYYLQQKEEDFAKPAWMSPDQLQAWVNRGLHKVK
jgi:hypothetical protein